ncbi:MAG TPA: hypothetical protein VHZ74_19040 [Bryobacteraceae bacterium]|jgi:hypothetical protein|nr:hypothetical protein [Bryobacteraceae bacterium]
MYSISPATVVLVEASGQSMRMRAGKDLRALVSDILLNSGDEFAFWAEEEARKAAAVWRETAVREAAGIHPDDCECDGCAEVGTISHNGGNEWDDGPPVEGPRQ